MIQCIPVARLATVENKQVIQSVIWIMQFNHQGWMYGTRDGIVAEQSYDAVWLSWLVIYTLTGGG